MLRYKVILFLIGVKIAALLNQKSNNIWYIIKWKDKKKGKKKKLLYLFYLD